MREQRQVAERGKSQRTGTTSFKPQVPIGTASPLALPESLHSNSMYLAKCYERAKRKSTYTKTVATVQTNWTNFDIKIDNEITCANKLGGIGCCLCEDGRCPGQVINFKINNNKQLVSTQQWRQSQCEAHPGRGTGQ